MGASCKTRPFFYWSMSEYG